jgi:hypothetical protein
MNADRPEFIGSGCCPHFISTALSTQRVEIRHSERYAHGARHGSASRSPRNMARQMTFDRFA